MDALASWVEVAADAVAQSRTACDELRWHEAYRRRWREVRAEASLRAAAASAELEGARLGLDRVRALAAGAAVPSASPSADLTDAVALGCVRANALVEGQMPDLGASGAAALAPLSQVLARLHTVVGLGWLPVDSLGRLRSDEPAQDLTGLGPAPSGRDVAARIDLLGRTVASTHAPALVVAAIAHAEVLAVRPFVAGNGAVARAVGRLLLTAGGLDPTGTALPEVAWAAAPQPYLGAAAGYATGTVAGVAAWIDAYARAVVAGAAEARVVADAVLG
ncbi:Fic family protein [Cellulomonas composti]|uniref:Fido domain-containing protein n=1 Tax=Cellulomonas composti TaxID=266130 RepID=A0A511JCS8_9CELL|nr:Fic family protein [Cellulomonas composti]GEL95784.1 hypothetical protein CCO02nite_24420 [Cellulomonas composti]